MSQKYDKIAKTLEYLIHKHFLFKTMTQTPRFHTKIAGSTVITAILPTLPEDYEQCLENWQFNKGLPQQEITCHLLHWFQ